MAQQDGIFECVAELKVPDFAAVCSASQTRPWGASPDWRQIASSGIMVAGEHCFALVVAWRICSGGEVDKDSRIGIAVKLFPGPEGSPSIELDVWLAQLSILNQAARLTRIKSDPSFEPLVTKDLRGWAPFFPSPGNMDGLTMDEVLDPSKGWLHDGALKVFCEMYVKPKTSWHKKASVARRCDFALYFASNDFADVVICAGDEESKDYRTFQAHRIILASRSPVFERMLLQPMSESCQQRIVFSDLSSALVVELLHYIYTDNVRPKTLEDDELVLQLLKAADRFELPELLECCSQTLEMRPAVETVCDWLYIASLVGCVRLQVQLLAFIRNHMAEVRATSSFHDLFRLCPKLFKGCNSTGTDLASTEFQALVQETVELSVADAAFDYVVSRATGRGEATNGHYVAVGMHKGKPKFKKIGGDAIMYYDKFWKMNAKDNVRHWFYCAHEPTQVEPPIGAWAHSHEDDATPPPVVMQGPCADRFSRRCKPVLEALLHGPSVPVPVDGLQKGDLVIYTGEPKQCSRRFALKRRHLGRVLDVASGNNYMVKFQDHSWSLEVEQSCLGWQQLPGGFSVGDVVRCIAQGKQSYGSCEDNERTIEEYSQSGELGTVTGPASDFSTESIEVSFDGETSDIKVSAVARHRARVPLRPKRALEHNEAPSLTISSKRWCPHRPADSAC